MLYETPDGDPLEGPVDDDEFEDEFDDDDDDDGLDDIEDIGIPELEDQNRIGEMMDEIEGRMGSLSAETRGLVEIVLDRINTLGAVFCEIFPEGSRIQNAEGWGLPMDEYRHSAAYSTIMGFLEPVHTYIMSLPNPPASDAAEAAQ